MSNKYLWEIEMSFAEGGRVVRRVTSDELSLGATGETLLQVPGLSAGTQLKIGIKASSDPKSAHVYEISSTGMELKVGGHWAAQAHLESSSIPELRFGGTQIKVREVGNERRTQRFEPESWVASFKDFEADCHSLWHIRHGQLIESVMLKGEYAPVTLKCGYEVVWNPKSDPTRLAVREHNGDVHGVEIEGGREQTLRANYLDDVFVITRVPDRKALSQLVTPLTAETESRHLALSLVSVLAIFFVLGFLIHLMPSTVKETKVLEELSPEMAKVVLEAPREKVGGDRAAGGGGMDTESYDKRGGAGLAALEKVAAGKSSALGSAGGVLSALSSLDHSLKIGKIGAAPGAAPAKRGLGSLTGVLGALGKIQVSGGGGGGVGVGGVGTKGFGGGGGGGKGMGYGTGIGDGLGKGEGVRNVSFESASSVVQGGLDRSEVDAVVQENISQIRFCYNRGLRSNPSLQGKVISFFKIGGDGAVTLSRLKDSTLAAPEVEDCIKSRVAVWKFPKPRGGGEVTVNYPFLLRSN